MSKTVILSHLKTAVSSVYARKDWKQEEKGTREGELVDWHHRLNGHEFEQALGVADGQRSLDVLQPMGLQRVRYDWATELNWAILRDEWGILLMS